MTARDTRRGGYVAPPPRPSAPRPPLRSQESWERDAQASLEASRDRRHVPDPMFPRGAALAYVLAGVAVIVIVLFIALALGLAFATNAPH